MSMTTWKSTLIGLGAGTLVLVAGLALGQPRASAHASGASPRLGPPPSLSGEGEIPLGEGLSIFGNPAQMSLFWTPDSPEQVIRSYYEAWSDAGFEPHINEVDQVSNVWFVEPATGLMRSVTVMNRGDETMVMPQISDARQMPDLTARNAPVPVPENATSYMAHGADDTTSLSYSASFMVALSPSRAIDFYKLEMGKLDYEFVESLSKTAKASHAEFRRDSELVTVAASVADPGNDGVSFVFVTHVREVGER